MTKREVKNIIPSDVVTACMLMDTSDMTIQIREKRDGSYTIHYPQEGWLPCPSNCNIRHKHDEEHPYTESYYRPSNFDDAYEYARWLARGREIEVIEYAPLHERKKKRSNDPKGE